VNDVDKKIIDSNGRSETVRIIHFNQPISQLSSKSEIIVDDKSKDETFTEGLTATVIEKVLSEKEEILLQQQRDQIIADAEVQAALIHEKAELEAKRSCELLYEEAQKKGYEDGLHKGMSEVKQAKNELEEITQKQNKDYLEQIETLEPQFANIVSSLVEKLTGITVEDKKEIILYLIHNAMVNADNSKAYIIKVSKDDYEFVLSKKEQLSSFVSGDITMDIVGDKDLNKNQCLIVTDTRIIDCSLDVQLSNLIQDIKFLSKQKE